MATQLKVGSFEHNPTYFTDYEAWVLIEGKWVKYNVAEVRDGVRTLTKEEFEKLFGHIAAPSAALQAGE